MYHQLFGTMSIPWSCYLMTKAAGQSALQGPKFKGSRVCVLFASRVGRRRRGVSVKNRPWVMGRALTYESDVRVPPRTSDVGVFRWQFASKRGSFNDKAPKIGGLSVKCIKNRGFQGQNGQKFLNISSNLLKFSKIPSFFAENCHFD